MKKKEKKDKPVYVIMLDGGILPLKTYSQLIMLCREYGYTDNQYQSIRKKVIKEGNDPDTGEKYHYYDGKYRIAKYPLIKGVVNNKH